MHFIISPAKTFIKKPRHLLKDDELSPLLFPKECDEVARATTQIPFEDFAKMLKISAKMKGEVAQQWQDFYVGSSALLATLEAYNGMVFKKTGAKDFEYSDWHYAQEHLTICSFLYGLLRPMDGIRPYRMEGDVMLGLERGANVFEYWRDLLTPKLIERVKAGGDNTLFYLASEEMKQLFHWKEVEQELNVVTPHFLTRQEDGSLKQIVIYTKMCRGTMLKAIIKHQIENLEELKTLSPQGFSYSPQESDAQNYYYILEQL